MRLFASVDALARQCVATRCLAGLCEGQAPWPGRRLWTKTPGVPWQQLPGRQGWSPPFLTITTMPLFWKPYKSDATQFIDSLKQRDPKLEERQRQGRSLLWDRDQDRDAEAEWQDARVEQQAYVYQTKG